MMSANDGSVGLCALSRKSVAIMMAESTLLKSCAMPPASWPTSSIFCCWVSLVLEFALRRGLERVDDGRFLVALLLLDRGDVEAPETLAVAGKRGVDRRNVALAARRLCDGGVERLAIAFGDDGADRSGRRLPRCSALWNSRANSGLVRTTPPSRSTVAIAIGVLWKKRMKRISAARCGSVPSSRARLRTSVREAPGVPSAPKASL